MLEHEDIYIMKIVIYGAKIPEHGILQYKFSVGFNKELEEFDFELDLTNVK
jgi:hypothetical protein